MGNAALALAWHPSGTRLGVSRKNGKFSIYDIRKLGSKPKAVCEKTLGWELNKFLFFGSGDRIVASYGHKSRGGYKVLKVRPASLYRVLRNSIDGAMCCGKRLCSMRTIPFVYTGVRA